MITLRLDNALEKSIENTAKNIGISKSELIRKSILNYLGKLKKPNYWDTGKEMFGRYYSGNKTLSSKSSILFKNKLSKKHFEKSNS